MTKRSSEKSMKIGRDAKNGQFISVKSAEKRKSTAIVETIKKSKLNSKIKK